MGATLKDAAFSVKGTAGMAASGRMPQRSGHEVGSAAAGWVNRSMVATPGVVKEDNSAADVSVIGDRKHWQQMSGVTAQAVERFDECE